MGKGASLQNKISTQFRLSPFTLTEDGEISCVNLSRSEPEQVDGRFGLAYIPFLSVTLSLSLWEAFYSISPIVCSLTFSLREAFLPEPQICLPNLSLPSDSTKKLVFYSLVLRMSSCPAHGKSLENSRLSVLPPYSSHDFSHVSMSKSKVSQILSAPTKILCSHTPNFE